MKLNKNEREEYRDLKHLFKADGGRFVTGLAGDRSVTLAVIKYGEFYHVAIAVQGRRDKPSKKRGRYEALSKRYNGCYIPVPVGALFRFGDISGLDLCTAFENQNLNK